MHPAPAPPATRPSARSAPQGRRWQVAVVGVVLLGAVVLLWGLLTPTLLPDERVYVVAGGEYVRGQFTTNLEHPLLGKLLFGLGAVLAELVVPGGSVAGVPAAVLGARLVAVLCAVLLALAVHRLVADAAGRWAGLATVAVWLAVPHALRTPGTAWRGFDRLDRYAMLDVPATMLATWGLVVALRWGRSRQDGDAVLAGLLFGLAAGAKLQAGLLVAGAVVVALTMERVSSRQLRGVALVGATSFATLLLTWLPAGPRAVDAVRFLLDFQGGHVARGHAVVLAGIVHERAPWWTHGYYAVRDDGLAVALLLPLLAVLGALLGAGSVQRRAVLAAAVAVPGLVLVLSPVALPFYRFVVLPPAVALAGLAGAAAFRSRHRWLRLPVLAGVLAAVVTCVLSLPSVVGRAPSDYRVVAAHLEAAGNPPVLLRGLEKVLLTYAPDTRLATRLVDAEVVVLDPVVTGTRPPTRVLERMVAEGWHRIEVDRLEMWTRVG